MRTKEKEKRGIALKVSCSNDDESFEDDEEMTLFTKRFKKFFQKNKEIKDFQGR